MSSRVSFSGQFQNRISAWRFRYCHTDSVRRQRSMLSEVQSAAEALSKGHRHSNTSLKLQFVLMFCEYSVGILVIVNFCLRECQGCGRYAARYVIPSPVKYFRKPQKQHLSVDPTFEVKQYTVNWDSEKKKRANCAYVRSLLRKMRRFGPERSLAIVPSWREARQHKLINQPPSGSVFCRVMRLMESDEFLKRRPCEIWKLFYRKKTTSKPGSHFIFPLSALTQKSSLFLSRLKGTDRIGFQI